MAQQKYTRELLEKLRGELANLPPRQPRKDDTLTKGEIIAEMRDVIVAMMGKGYRFEDIAEELRKRELEISAATLKTYVKKATDKIQGESKKRGRKPGKKAATGTAHGTAKGTSSGTVKETPAASPEKTTGESSIKPAQGAPVKEAEKPPETGLINVRPKVPLSEL